MLCVLTVLAIFSPSPAMGGKAAPDKVAPRTHKSKRGRQILPVNAKILQVAGHAGFLALPKDVKPGRKTPWLWYLPTANNLPGKLEQWMIDKCLANGIAVAGIDLGGDFGTPAGRVILTAFHKEVTRNRGLTKKACMLARSYGGLQMYNWAAEHPESVACLAGIYPVCNMASYPGLKSASRKYGMTEEKFVKELRDHNPVDRLAPLAKAKVPIYHNTGDVDTLVPAKDNSFLVAKRYKALGGDIAITVFKGQGHNYWPGFFEDKAMAAFIIKHAKRVASIPRVLIVGDSISGGYGKPLIKLLEGKVEIVKLGAVAGYRIQKETFWHSRGPAKNLDFGSAKACIADFERFERHLSETKYDVIHFNFGLNDIFRGRKGAWHNPVDQYARDLAKIVTLLKKNGAKIIWANTTPIPANDAHRPEGDDLIYNAAAEKVMKKNNIPINDLHGVVTKWDGYAEWKKGDNVHFPGAVYSKLARRVAEKISAQLEANKTRGKPL
ncbi:MAG: GDSL-type esterase/lipase family protein [Phycisphaerae bacterium]|jgi:lysophospholipase L1-like esterase|nr:GDSL-type esterase/lipase family protein [Phycisphaerae bacterium]